LGEKRNMNKKIISVLVILMMSLVIIPASSTSTIVKEPIKKATSQQMLKVMIFCVIEISGEGEIWSLPGLLIWRIDSGNIKITYLGGEHTETSGRGLFLLHLGTKADNPVNIGGVAPIGILF
jgi:hypothetical protein